MVDTLASRKRLRRVLIAIILGTIPCYCLGGIAVALRGGARVTATPTMEVPAFTATEPLQILSPTSNPAIVSETPSEIPSETPTVTPSPTQTFTPTNTFTATATVPSVTNTYTYTPTNTPTLTPSSTFTPSNTPTSSFTPEGAATTITPSITPFPNP